MLHLLTMFKDHQCNLFTTKCMDTIIIIHCIATLNYLFIMINSLGICIIDKFLSIIGLFLEQCSIA